MICWFFMICALLYIMRCVVWYAVCFIVCGVFYDLWYFEGYVVFVLYVGFFMTRGVLCDIFCVV